MASERVKQTAEQLARLIQLNLEQNDSEDALLLIQGTHVNGAMHHSYEMKNPAMVAGIMVADAIVNGQLKEVHHFLDSIQKMVHHARAVIHYEEERRKSMN